MVRLRLFYLASEPWLTEEIGFLFKPNLPFMKKARRQAPFFGLHDSMPVVLALLLGFQHALAMLAGVSEFTCLLMCKLDGG